MSPARRQSPLPAREIRKAGKDPTAGLGRQWRPVGYPHALIHGIPPGRAGLPAEPPDSDRDRRDSDKS